MPHLLTNFEIKKFYQNKPKFDSVTSLNNLPKIRDGACIINLDQYELLGTHWVVLNGNAEM